MQSADYQSGYAEGLRQALEIVEALLVAEELKLDLPAPYATRSARRTRWQAYRNAMSRLRTALKRTGSDGPVPGAIEGKLKRLGL